MQFFWHALHLLTQSWHAAMQALHLLLHESSRSATASHDLMQLLQALTHALHSFLHIADEWCAAKSDPLEKNNTNVKTTIFCRLKFIRFNLLLFVF